MVEIIISFVIATFVLAISPGPDNIFVLTQSMAHGKKYGIATVLGLMTGCMVHTTFVAFGVSEIIKHNDQLFFSIKLCGACYLLYLAYKVYQNSDTIKVTTAIAKHTRKALFVKGFLMNVLNPKVTIFFLALFPQFLFSKTLSTLWQFYILGGIFMLVSFFVFSLIAISSSAISRKLNTNTTITRYLKWMQILIFIGIAGFIFS